MAKSGAEFGGAAGGIAGSLNAGIGAYRGLTSLARQSAAQDALDLGVPLYKNNIAGSKALDYLSSASNEIPAVIGGTSGRLPEQQQAIMGALNEKIGQTGTELTKDTVDQALSETGAAIGSINKNYSIQGGVQLNSDLKMLQTQAKQQLTGDNLDLFNKRISSIKADIKSNGGQLPGVVYQQTRSALGSEAYNTAQGSTAQYSRLLGNLQETLDNHFAAAASPQDAQQLQILRTQYRNAKTLQPLTDRYPLGDFPLSAINAKTVDNPDLQPIGNVAQLFKGMTGNSGTAQRQLLYKAGSALGGIGGGIAGLHAADPDWGNNAMEMAGIVGAATVPGLANRALNPQITPFSLNGLSAAQPYSQQISKIANLMRRAPAAVPLFGSLYPQNQGGNNVIFSFSCWGW